MKKICAGLVILLSLQSGAVIRVVRGGGGLAELQMIHLHQKLDSYLKLCLQSQNPCSMEPSRRQEIQQLIAKHPADSAQFYFEFTGMQNPRIFEILGTRVLISSAALYGNQSQPQPIKNLLAITVMIRLRISGTQLTDQENFRLARQLFQNLNQSHQSQRLMVGPQSFWVHSFDYVFGSLAAKALYFEQESNSIEITKGVENRLPCGRLAEWKFENWRSSTAESTLYFYADAKALCLGARSRPAVIVISGSLDVRGKIRPDALNIQFKD